MALVYRGMLPDGGGPLVAANNANALGVRYPPNPTTDIQTYLNGAAQWVNPVTPAGAPQGMSVATGSGCNLPPHRRPSGAPWNGSGRAGLRMWQLDDSTLHPAQLTNTPAPTHAHPHHAVIAPGEAMAVVTYIGDLDATVGNWSLAPDPAVACAAAVLGEGGTVHPEVDRLATAVARGGDHAPLIEALLAANRAGTPGAQLIAGLDTRAQQLDQAGDDDGAEALRAVLDRLTGFCAPDQRVDLA